MSYPKTVSKFEAWTKAMVRNAQVGTPDYGKSSSRGGKMATKPRRKKRKRRRRSRAKKEA